MRDTMRILIHLGSILMTISVLRVGAAEAVNEECVMNDGNLLCNLRMGQAQYYVQPNKVIVLRNLTGDTKQLNRIYATPDSYSGVGEYCIQRSWAGGGAFNLNPPGQIYPGFGEVGCHTKLDGEPYADYMSWNGTTSNLRLNAGDEILIVFNAPSSGNELVDVNASGVDNWLADSWRQPQRDFTGSCGGWDLSPWSPWINDTGAVKYIYGAEVYATGNGGLGDGYSVNDACVYILNTSGGVRWSYCNGGLNHEGHVFWGWMAVYPGEYVAAQSQNYCSGGVWDWVAYIPVI